MQQDYLGDGMTEESRLFGSLGQKFIATFLGSFFSVELEHLGFFYNKDQAFLLQG